MFSLCLYHGIIQVRIYSSPISTLIPLILMASLAARQQKFVQMHSLPSKSGTFSLFHITRRAANFRYIMLCSLLSFHSPLSLRLVGGKKCPTMMDSHSVIFPIGAHDEHVTHSIMDKDAAIVMPE
jgi:hypothetical protein